ncbi:AAL062Wp [Eremothecium gossypii ATCC 10895]|uniref:AAL062Wp n=1 Tax=Eremothecium gossypii (strain ATCC 10895 / CBS 109.51 / FGSC 9923 / NRRL Y-1056) TaxID=284811 RepID=Q75EZ0_EREGS|nr:AAL062Wp [Eremothecium gossypii ATCC 10895]AAS50304.1 AAL062Wp [Eremothecium gossypii ATCC 10895]AEY94590.1 FAAL062Wp [Eremothecium gossypii FDAG1]
MDFLLRPIDSKECSVITFVPTPGFVIKSKLEHGKDATLVVGTKTFVNVCHHTQVPLPDVPFDASIVYPLIMENKWEIPIVTSAVRRDADKKGQECYVWDCCINSECMQWIEKDYQLREILVEWCLESCELRQSVGISREAVVFPRMKSKGALPAVEVLQQDLTHDYKHEIAENSSLGMDDPRQILHMRGALDEEASGDDGTLPSLFPERPATRPLIEEVNTGRHSASVEAPKTLPACGLPRLEFAVTMGRPRNDANYKIKVQVASALNSGHAYSVHYDGKENSLLVTSTSQAYEPKEICIPLPGVVAGTRSMRALFLKRSNALVVFL